VNNFCFLVDLTFSFLIFFKCENIVFIYKKEMIYMANYKNIYKQDVERYSVDVKESSDEYAYLVNKGEQVASENDYITFDNSAIYITEGFLPWYTEDSSGAVQKRVRGVEITSNSLYILQYGILDERKDLTGGIEYALFKWKHGVQEQEISYTRRHISSKGYLASFSICYLEKGYSIGIKSVTGDGLLPAYPLGDDPISVNAEFFIKKI
jgi:hypothetical protein